MKLSNLKSLFILYLEHKKNSINYNAVNSKGLIHKKAILKGASIYGNVKIGEGTRIMNGVSIKTTSEIIIGKNTSINGPNTDMVSEINKIIIGNFCSIARNVVFQEFNHKFQSITSYFIKHNIFKEKKINDIQSKGDIVLGNDVWVGTQCVILSGANIGNGAVIAANSVVTGHVPAYTIAAGSPAKVLKKRFSDEIINKLEEIQWWNWSDEKIKQNKDLFDGDLTLEKLNNIK